MPQANGLSMLGSVILGASDRAATQRREDELLKRQQARQDALLADERKYKSGVLTEERAYDKTVRTEDRKARLEDDLTLNAQRAKAAAVQALINEGILKYEDRQDERALAAAYQTAQQLGIIEKYKTLIEGGYLKAEEAGDMTKVKTALDDLGKTAGTERTRTETVRTRSDAQATDVARKLAQAEAEEQQVIKKLQDLDQIVSTGGMPAQADVLREATRRAQLAVPGRQVVPNAEIQALVPKVAEDLRNQRLDAASQQQLILQRQLEGVRSVRSGLVSQQNVLANRGSFAAPEPTTSAVIAPPPAAAPTPAAGNPMSGFLQQLEQEAARNPPPPPPIQQGQPGWVPPSAPPGLPSGFTPPMRSASTGGRPITPSANLFPTSAPWWRAVA